MITIRTKAEVRAHVAAARAAGRSVGLVPTMGAFHAGHHALMRAAREACDEVVVSLFVNPAQFDEAADLAAYPRDEARDAAEAAGLGVDVLFAPSAEEIYPDGFATTVRVEGLSDVLEGAERGPGHFAGVCTVVAKLLNIVDARRRLLRPEGRPAGRRPAADGRRPRHPRPGSRSSRPSASPTGWRCPAATSASTRPSARRAVALSRALRAAEPAIAAGERDADALRAAALAAMAPHDVDPEYLALVDPDSFAPVDDRQRPRARGRRRAGRRHPTDRQRRDPDRPRRPGGDPLGGVNHTEGALIHVLPTPA